MVVGGIGEFLHCLVHSLLRPKFVQIGAFVLQSIEIPLHRCIVVWISGLAHALDHVGGVRIQIVQFLFSGILIVRKKLLQNLNTVLRRIPALQRTFSSLFFIDSIMPDQFVRLYSFAACAAFFNFLKNSDFNTSSKSTSFTCRLLIQLFKCCQTVFLQSRNILAKSSILLIPHFRDILIFSQHFYKRPVL